MPKTHWKKLHNPNYFGCWCFEEGMDMVLTIRHVTQEPVKDENGRQEQCMVIHFAEPGAKPLICNKTNAKMLEKLCGSAYIEDWAGTRIQLYADHNVRFGKERVDGVRIRPRVTLSGPAPILCTDCGKAISGGEFGGKAYTAAQIAAINQKRYGVPLCAECSAKRKEEADHDADA